VAAAIRVAPRAVGLELASSVGGNFFRSRQHAAATVVYEAALAKGLNPQIAAYHAFILAVSSDPGVRDPIRALAWAEQAVAAETPSVTSLNTLAVAQAATGNFAQAVATAEQALALARAGNQAAAAQVTEARLRAFRAGQPWRE
jgi:cytochrome c-type biogenesis protein CcmH/NrfG